MRRRGALPVWRSRGGVRGRGHAQPGRGRKEEEGKKKRKEEKKKEKKEEKKRISEIGIEKK
jgi:hypothetical protein